MKVLSFLYIVSAPIRAWGSVVRGGAIQDKSVTPLLGRGYSIQTNSMASTCLSIEATVRPTYDFDYKMFQVQSASSVVGRLSGTLGAKWLEGEMRKFTRADAIAAGDSSDEDAETTFFVVNHIAIDRYYSSVQDESAVIVPAAAEMLDNGFISQFFTSCGPSYIRSIRRTAESNTLIAYRSSGSDTFGQNIVNAFDQPDQVDTTNTSRLQNSSSFRSLIIKMKADGLSGKDSANRKTLAIRGLEDFATKLRSVLNIMADEEVGVVKSVEVIPWVANPFFLTRIKIAQKVPAAQNGDNLSVLSRKFNLISNAEHIARIEAMLNKKMVVQEKIMMCTGELVKLMTFRDQKLVNYKCAVSSSCGEKTIGDLYEDLGASEAEWIYERLFDDLNSYLTGVYGPCLTQLEIFNPEYRLSHLEYMSWSAIPECNKMPCALPGTSYSAQQGTCSPMQEDITRAIALADQYCMPTIVQ